MNEDLLNHVMKQSSLVLTLHSKLRDVSSHLQLVEREKEQLKQRVAELEGEVKELKEQNEK